MKEDGRVVTAKLPDALAAQLDEVAERIERTKSWIMREAVSQWLVEENRRYDLTMEALLDVEEGRTIDHSELVAWANRKKREARKKPAA